jgi:leucine dehydrogenase
MYPYTSEHDAVADVLRLSRGMTYKAAICELPYGGGKSVIIGDPRRDKTPALLHAMGRLVEDLRGRYIIADDVGTTTRGPRHNAGGDAPYRGGDGGDAASPARDRVRRIRGVARCRGRLPRPPRRGGVASRRPRVG